nr:hypothetical protein [Tanacetum cinerariifolium]
MGAPDSKGTAHLTFQTIQIRTVPYSFSSDNWHEQPTNPEKEKVIKGNSDSIALLRSEAASVKVKGLKGL